MYEFNAVTWAQFWAVLIVAATVVLVFLIFIALIVAVIYFSC